MTGWEVEVYLGGGGDRDVLGTYLVWAMNEALAVQLALNHATLGLGAEAKALLPDFEPDEIDYDGVLGSAPARFSGS